MMKKIWKSPWAIALIPVVVSTILTALYDGIKDKPILSTLLTWVSTIWSWIVEVLNYNLRIWWLIVGVIVIVFLLYVIKKFTSEKRKSLPEFLSYKEDYFGNWKWSWDWNFSSRDFKWHVNNLRAHCPRCDTPMFHDSEDTIFQCPRCDFQTDYGSKHKRGYEVEALIIDNLDRRNKFDS